MIAEQIIHQAISVGLHIFPVRPDTKTPYKESHGWKDATNEFEHALTMFQRHPFRGDGIFKSIDNGITWTQLLSTVSGTPHIYDNAFDYVHNIAVSKTTGYGSGSGLDEACESFDTAIRHVLGGAS